MKQPKKLSRSQKELAKKCGLKPNKYMNQFEDHLYLHLVEKGKDDTDIVILDKVNEQIVETRISHKKKGSAHRPKQTEPIKRN